MKNKLGDKILLVIMMLIDVALIFAVIGCALMYIPKTVADGVIAYIYSGVTATLIVVGISIVLLVACIRLLFFGNRRQSTEAPPSIVVSAEDAGVTTVSLAAIDSMVQRHCRQNTQIKECGTSIKPLETGLALALKLTLYPDANIPKLTSELRESLKAYIEAGCGVSVNEISIVVAAIQQRSLIKGEASK